jgi:hypothetical protein
MGAADEWDLHRRTCASCRTPALPGDPPPLCPRGWRLAEAVAREVQDRADREAPVLPWLRQRERREAVARVGLAALALAAAAAAGAWWW